MRSSRAAELALVALMSVAPGCSSDQAADPTPAGPAPTSAAPPPAPATAAPSPTGVPGIDVGDELCANWARYSGSLQIIAVAANFADLSPLELAGLELAAAPTVDSAVAAIGAAWPEELASERTAALERYLGPYARRAAKAIDALRAAGFTAEDVAATEQAWAGILAAHDPDQPMVAVQLPADARLRLDGAAAAFDAAVTPFTQDPSLQVRLDDVPATKGFLARSCPHLASIGVGDDV